MNNDQLNRFLQEEDGLVDLDEDADVGDDSDERDFIHDTYDDDMTEEENEEINGEEAIGSAPPRNSSDNNDDEDDDILLFILGAYHVLERLREHMNNRPRRNPHIPVVRLDIDAYDDVTCERLFRFRADEIRDIITVLRVPDIFNLANGSKILSLEAVCVVLRRLAYPCRFIDLMQLFGRSEGILSRITGTVLRWIYNRWAHLLFNWDHTRLQPALLEEFADAIHEAGSPLRRVVGFIDGTVQPVARPEEGQEQDYNGHHRVHAMKYQAVTTPDGIIVQLSGPYQEREQGSAIYRASGLQETLMRWSRNRNNDHMYLYGDPAYQISPVLQVPYPTVGISPTQARFNEAMSKVKVAVEWSFSPTLPYFAFSDYKGSQRSLHTQVHLHYVISVLFNNIHSCITETNASVSRFEIIPPTLEEYFHFS